jgi:hypothetical protein
MFSQHLKKFIVGAVVATATVAQAQAATVDLAPPGFTSVFFNGNLRNIARSVVLQADSTVQITGFGVRMDPQLASFNLTAEIFAWNSVTKTRGGLLQTATQGFTDGGLRFYDIAISQPLSSGQFYELNLKSIASHTVSMEFFNFNTTPVFDFFGNPLPLNTPYAAGPVTVFDGCATGTNAGGCGNTLLPHFQVAAVPEPAEWTMLIAGLLVVGFIARRRQKSGV